MSLPVQRVPRTSPQEVREKMRTGRVYLVCAYNDEEQCRQSPIDGALTLRELERRLGSIGPDAELVFYCA